MSETVLQPLKVADIEQMMTQSDNNQENNNKVYNNVNVPVRLL